MRLGPQTSPNVPCPTCNSHLRPALMHLVPHETHTSDQPQCTLSHMRLAPQASPNAPCPTCESHLRPALALPHTPSSPACACTTDIAHSGWFAGCDMQVVRLVARPQGSLKLLCLHQYITEVDVPGNILPASTRIITAVDWPPH